MAVAQLTPDVREERILAELAELTLQNNLQGQLETFRSLGATSVPGPSSSRN